MKRCAASVSVALFIGFLLLGFLRPADADSSDGFSLSVSHRKVHPGQPLRVTAQAEVTCTWAVEWDGVRRVFHGKVFTTTFTAPEVTKSTTLRLQARCFYHAVARNRPGTKTGAPLAATGPTDPQTVIVTVPPSWSTSLGIDVLPAAANVSPPAHPHHGGLPGTGGPQLWPLLVGLATALTGFLLVGASARRRPVAGEA
jgi:hypothetical protein